jgi:transposase
MTDTGDRAATDPTTLHREAFELIRDALDLPLAAINGDHDQTRVRLLDRRVEATLELIRMMLMFEHDPDLIRRRIEHLRTRIDQLPVTYRRYGCEVHEPDEPCCAPFVTTR